MYVCVHVIMFFSYSTWQVVYFSESELGGRVPRFFNMSLCGSVDYAGPSSACQNSSVCYSELLDRYYSLGSTGNGEGGRDGGRWRKPTREGEGVKEGGVIVWVF